MIPILSAPERGVYDSENGSFINGAAARLAQLLADFDDSLVLQYIPAAQRDASDAQPYRIIQDAPGHEPYVVMYLREDQLDHRVLARLAEAQDFGRGGAIDLNQHLAYEEAARQIFEAKRMQEEREERMDMAKFLIKTPLHTVKFNGKTLHL